MTAAPLPPPLHPRLTVVRADEAPAEVARRLAKMLVSEVFAAHHVLDDARRRAAAAFEQRVAVRDEAVARRTGLAARRTHLLERAEWCEATAGTARALAAALAEAEARAAEAQAAVDAASRRRDRVAEQRAAAKAALEEAHLELEALEGATLDETGVRRELENATRAERSASHALEAADADVATMRARVAELEATHDALIAARAQLLARAEGAALDAVDPDAEAALRDALSLYDELAQHGGPDPAAQSLAEALSRLTLDLAALRETTPEPPTDGQLAGAEADVAVARRRLDAARASAASVDGPAPQWWVELTAVHAQVVEAEAALATGGLRKSGARRRYEEAVEAEQARLAELGFGNYLDALMSGGKLPGDRATDDRHIAGAAAALDAAEAALEQMRSDLLGGAPIIELIAEQERLLDVAARTLGCDPRDRVLELLAEHPAVPPMVLADLANALHALAVPTAGIGVGPAARRWVAERDAATNPQHLTEIESRLAGVSAERRAAEAALDAATASAERATTEASTSARAVSSLEAELRARAGDDGRLLERATAARALRDQVEAVEAHLAEAETEALQSWGAAVEVLAAVQDECERVQQDRTELARRASRAAAELPAERRPAFDLVTGLVPLGAALRAEAVALGVTLDMAERAVAEAVAACGGGPSNPSLADVEAGLRDVVAGAPHGAPIVFAEPFDGIGGIDTEDVERLLGVLLDATDGRPTVVVTSELAVIGWAIGLPGTVGALVLARSLDPVLTGVHAD